MRRPWPTGCAVVPKTNKQRRKEQSKKIRNKEKERMKKKRYFK
jgi:hypothetical protein